MPFASGFVLLTAEYKDEPKRSEVKKHLESLGFEVYDIGDPYRIVFYVEVDDLGGLERIIKAAETHEGIAKAYIVYGFLGDSETKRRINEALLSGEAELDESTRELIEWILSRLKAQG
ncbi:hypothetical protein Pyrfu_1328 [Pyrolobus fumarii 1A]|uniref:Uncharacterized protein n=1 Tax=Pyrolobus fumarii (strain DSM 11204 / 1A) TaxID=694429 RepID=G0EGG1_PYRF1|nr:hypothetical protein [Pyrolobus fumarii]AEM39186.1 hypothetical protein Pyrfu_1328 [Pyrolobus fumarii 1A]